MGFRLPSGTSASHECLGRKKVSKMKSVNDRSSVMRNDSALKHETLYLFSNIKWKKTNKHTHTQVHFSSGVFTQRRNEEWTNDSLKITFNDSFTIFLGTGLKFQSDIIQCLDLINVLWGEKKNYTWVKYFSSSWDFQEIQMTQLPVENTACSISKQWNKHFLDIHLQRDLIYSRLVNIFVNIE